MGIDIFDKFISTIGFPIAVAVYLLVRIDPLLRAMNENLIKLTTLIDEKLREDHK